MAEYKISILAQASFERIVETDNPDEALKEAVSDLNFLDEEIGCDFLLAVDSVVNSEINKLEE